MFNKETNMKTNELPQLEIRIDGILQEPTAIERVGTTAVSLIEAAGRALGSYVGNVAMNIREDVELGLFDATHNTSLYTQKYDHLRQERIASKMGKLGLS
jgi:hypothetical protein